MIFYFTGTGNSLYVAQKLAEYTKTQIASIAEIMDGKRKPEWDEVTGIVYPIYAWSPPKMVLDFVKKYPIQSEYVFSVCTCGDEAGQAMKVLEKRMGQELNYAASIAMPNNYIVGFDVDSKDIEKAKLAEAEAKIITIAEGINIRKSGIYDVVEGSMPKFKTKIIPPLLNTFASPAKKFYAEDSCIGCGKCEEVCPTKNVHVEGKPTWGNNCTSCLACIHHCPVKAIQYGKGTRKKGRYVNPNCQVEYHFK